MCLFLPAICACPNGIDPHGASIVLHMGHLDIFLSDKPLENHLDAPLKCQPFTFEKASAGGESLSVILDTEINL